MSFDDWTHHLSNYDKLDINYIIDNYNKTLNSNTGINIKIEYRTLFNYFIGKIKI